jgi:MFS family permease
MTESATQTPDPPSSAPADPAIVAVLALGITQIASWGTTLYSLGVLARPIAADTGWSQSLVYGGMTIGLLTSAVISAPMGRLVDRRGGRAVMALGSALAAMSLFALAGVTSIWQYFAVWVVIGIAMRMTLYDAAFAALVQVTPSRGRRAISYLTLFGGFASSVFWPLGMWLDARYGWRATLMIFALVNLLICLPLHWFGLARREDAAHGIKAASNDPTASGTARAPLAGGAKLRAMLLFGLVLAAAAFVFGALAAHLVPLLEWTGIGAAAAIGLASLKGFAQVAGRVCELVWGRMLHPVTLGRIAIAFLPLSFGALLVGGASLAAASVFTLLFGIANGLTTIVRGAVPLALFGAKDYGEILGILATPYLVLNAIAPVIMAVIVERGGYAMATSILLVVGAAAFLAMEIMAAWYRRQPD